MSYLMLHGLGQTAASWQKTIALLQHREDCITPELTGLPENPPCDYAQLYRHFSDICSASEKPLHLCGLSLGGILALQYTLEHPEQVQSLVLIGTPYKMPVKLLHLQNAIFRIMPESAFSDSGLTKQQMIGFTRSMLHLDYSSSLHTISCPTLVLYGANDRANRRAAYLLSETIPGAVLRSIPGAGHEVNTEAPALLAQQLNLFYHNGKDHRHD